MGLALLHEEQLWFLHSLLKLLVKHLLISILQTAITTKSSEENEMYLKKIKPEFLGKNLILV